jgi:transposase
MKQYQQLQVARRQGRSVSDISKMLCRDRKTVRKYLAMEAFSKVGRLLKKRGFWNSGGILE